MVLAGKVVLKLWNAYISSSIHLKESSFKVPECIYHHGCIRREVVLKLRDVCIIKCSSKENLFLSYRMSSIHRKETFLNLRNV